MKGGVGEGEGRGLRVGDMGWGGEGEWRRGGVDGRKVGMKRGKGPEHEIRDVRGVRTQQGRRTRRKIMTKGGRSSWGEEEWKRHGWSKLFMCSQSPQAKFQTISSKSRFEALPPFDTSDSMPTFGTQRNIWSNVAMI